MNAVYITPDRFNDIGSLPISLPQTELRRGSIVQASVFNLAPAQIAVVRVFNLTVLKVLTPGVIPDIINSTFGIVGAGVYGPVNSWGGHMACSPFIRVASNGLGTASLNPYVEYRVATPGVYVVAVFNNTGRASQFALDVSVNLTGLIKFYA